MTTKQDNVRDILFTALDECVAKNLIDQTWADQIERDIEDTLEMSEKNVSQREYFSMFDSLVNDIQLAGLKNKIVN
jgi:hypothetical protein